MEQVKSVGIWIRVSTEDQAQGDAPEHHEKRARMYAEAKGWHVGEVYHLEAISGKSVIEHPEAKRMLRDIRDGKISALIFSKLARLARNTKQLLEFADYFKQYDADLVSIAEAIDTSTPAGRLFYTMIAAMAQWEREEIAGRIAASVPIRAKLGKQIGGEATLGYKWVDKKLVVDETEAPLRKLVYELFLTHKRKRTVARLLNEMGYRTRGGKPFNDTGIKRLLTNPTAKGTHLANYTTNKKGKGMKELKPESEWILTKCPAIVSVELWDECNRILAEQTKKRDKPGRKAVHLLSGYVYCSCGKKMYVFHRDENYACRPCKRKISASDLDEIYHEHLGEFLLAEVDSSEFLGQSEALVSEKEELLRKVLEDSANLRKRMTELVNMRMGKELSRETFMEHNKPLEDQLKQLSDQIPELEGAIAFLRVQSESSEIVLQDAKSLYARWPIMTSEERRTIVERITDAIVIDEEDITIKLSHTPASLRNGGKEQSSLKGGLKYKNVAICLW
jgi:site-specific DNA recombinase